jgi:uncharacterized membrane protein
MYALFKSGGGFISNNAGTSQLLEEYRINADFWKHHDTMRQKKMENFLTANSILAAAIALLTSSIFSDIQVISIILIVGISIIGFIISLTWNSVIRRNSEYMHFQRLQLCSIEQELPKCSMTFTKMYRTFDENMKVDFPHLLKPLPNSFKTKMKSANKLDRNLPMIIAGSWIIVVFSCVIFLTQMFILS